MASARARIVVGGCVIAGALAYLASAAMRSNWVYYQSVDAFVAGASADRQRVRLHGRVSETELDVRPVELRASFWIEGVQHRLRVEYRGVLPEQFKPGAEAVVEGVVNDQNVFLADGVMTKCAGKYQALQASASSERSGTRGACVEP